MDAVLWQQVKEIVASAIELPGLERSRFVDRANLEPTLRAQVEAYLQAYDDSPGFLDTSDSDGVRLPASLAAGDLVGDYRVVRQIGQGGMGEVFAAQQQSVQRQVALKLLNPGRRSDSALARFESERQMLAAMNHPNIAQIFGAGEVAGRPYLAMELVAGQPLTTYCDGHELSIEDRLQLFMRVCRGVQHAHQRGVIHRDLKPSNILVCEQDGAVPKVIDFGISKMIGDETEGYTRDDQWLGTPAYMSPEQAAMGAGSVDTRSDVYSLGVLLYELLTGVLPFDVAALRRDGLENLLRTLREQPPLRPSLCCSEPAAEENNASSAGLPTAVQARAKARGLEVDAWVQRLQGDLDLVLLKALEKNPEERYSSPVELARDLARHLSHQPLMAAAPSTAYLMSKLLRRHRLSVAAGVAILMSLVAGVVGTSVGLLRAREAEEQAEDRAVEARLEAERANREATTATRVTDFMAELFQAPDPNSISYLPGMTLRQLLDRGAERVRRELPDEPRVQARLMATMGRTFMSLGLLPVGRGLLEESVAILEDVAPNSQELAVLLHYLGEVQIELADHEGSLRSLRRSLEMRRRVLGEKHYEVSWVLHDIGRALAVQGNAEESIESYQQALALKREIYGENHQEVARTLNSVGMYYIDHEQVERGFTLVARALAILEETYQADHPMLAPSLNNLAKAHWLLGHLAEAEALQRRVLAIDEESFGADHPHVATSIKNLALMASQQQRCVAAREGLRRAHAINVSHFAEGHPVRQETASLLLTVDCSS